MTERKTKADRLNETLAILRKLDDVGAGPDKGGEGYIEIKKRLSDWVQTGDAWAGKVRFPSIKRVADCIFPNKKSAIASVNLRVI